MRFNSIKDLRQLDENEFEELFIYLKKRTKNFTRFYPDIVLENNQYLLIVRICLGLSQKEWGNKMENTKDWCRHIESKRHKIIHESIANRYCWKIQRLLNEKQINFKEALRFWRAYKFSSYQKFTETKIRFSSISKLTEKDLHKFFNLVRIKTKNFSNFNVKILLEVPQSILIFRIITGFSHRKFAKLLGLNARSIRSYETGKSRIKPQTAQKIMNEIENIFKENKAYADMEFNKLLENYRILRGFFGHRNLQAMVVGGVQRLAKLKTNEFEKQIAKLLESNGILFEQFSIINGIKRRYNVDFLIPNSQKPKFVIEAFRFATGGKSRNVKNKVVNIDHRFQAIKLKYPAIKTAIVMELIGRPVLAEFVKNSLELETMNTDFIFINESQKLPLMIKTYHNQSVKDMSDSINRNLNKPSNSV